MHHSEHEHIDFGTGQKTLGMYFAGVAGCVILTLIPFFAVMSGQLGRIESIVIIFTSAVLQFLVQIFAFLRLNVRTEQGLYNVMAFVYTLMILLCIVAGSLWIMANLDYYMMN